MRKFAANFIPIALAAFLHNLADIAEGSNLKTFKAEYGPFNGTHDKILEVIKPAIISNDALQLTPELLSEDNTVPMSDNSARVLLKQPFKLWEDENGPGAVNLASFNTSFLFSAHRINKNTTGEGLAFILVPDLSLPPNSYRQFLGLTNFTSDGSKDNKLVAVELDTFQQDFDPDNNHVGIDVNSVISIKTEPLTKHNITIASVEHKLYVAWIDYDALNMAIHVYIAEQGKYRSPTPQKPGSPILSARLNLRDHLNQYSYFGFSASGTNSKQLNCVLRWNLTVHHFPNPEPLGKRWKIAMGAGAAALVLLLTAASVARYCTYKQRTASFNRNLAGALKCLPGTPKEFRFKDLKNATKGFDESNKLGQGGFGVVYKGLLVRERIEIAVKWFSRESIQGQQDFLSELTIINRLRHKHLVKLLGWCYKKGKLLLVYEYMPNGSLDQHLFVGRDREPLEWNLRQQVLSGVASALHYLHTEYEQKVVHRDLKASNIMLDSNFNARLGDFGLARALDSGKTSYAEVEGVMGTMGYIAPECFLTGKATQQADVYAFGAVLLEVVSGQRPGAKIAGFQFLVDWVWLLHRDGNLLEAVDQRLGDKYIAEEAERLLLLGLACSHPNATERPKTQDILQIIPGTMPVPTVPPFKPAFEWPAGGPMNMETIDSLSVTSSDFASALREHVGHTEEA